MTNAIDRIWLLIALSAAWLVTPAISSQANDDPVSADGTKIVIEKPEVPERNVEFRETEEPLKLRLFAADPALLEQKYVATINLGADARPPRIGNSRRLYHEGVENPLRGRWGKSNIDYLAETIPKGQPPAEDILQRLRDSNYLILNRPEQKRPEQDGERHISFHVLGRDVDQVEALSLALLDLYDHGLWYPTQQQAYELMITYQKAMDESTAKLAKVQDELEPLARRVEDLEPITQDTISNLKTQQRLTLVDMAAAKARIDACARILLRDDVRGKPIAEEVESIKIAAEIELVGLAARREAVDEIVKEGTEYRDLRSDLNSKQTRVVSFTNEINRYKDALRTKSEQRQHFQPIPLIGNAITIQPVEWQSSRTR